MGDPGLRCARGSNCGPAPSIDTSRLVRCKGSIPGSRRAASRSNLTLDWNIFGAAVCEICAELCGDLTDLVDEGVAIALLVLANLSCGRLRPNSVSSLVGFSYLGGREERASGAVVLVLLGIRRARQRRT